MKILIISFNQIDKYNWGHELFRREIARQHDVIFFGPGHSPKKVKLHDYLKSLNTTIDEFDFVFTYGLKYTKKIPDIYDIPDHIFKVHYVIDYFLPKGEFKGRALDQHEFLNSYKPDIVFSVYYDSIKPLKKNIICENIYCLPFSACSLTYRNFYCKKINKVATCFSRRQDAYPDRIIALDKLKRHKIRIVDRKMNVEYVKTINRCKITLGVNDIYKSLNMRVTEILSCGGFLLTNKPNYIERLGLIDGEHYISYSDFDDMISKIRYYFNNDKERNRIELNGMKLVRQHHSCTMRIHEMIDIIKRVKLS